ncbi:hypothetical protein DICVIV_13625 [Dictyocaulus viviparus]|uniref:Uncharacterized protein n=1 Tax=Dictyocaulus viviparus TaxID=29172 RepID=A0A0D8X9W0_DICVI|nr:hypothetical protein DICVIV_13625 [Dictyocaulus viviparus]
MVLIVVTDAEVFSKEKLIDWKKIRRKNRIYSDQYVDDYCIRVRRMDDVSWIFSDVINVKLVVLISASG